jgi:F-type H+-transporting ATPase subunit alpha
MAQNPIPQPQAASQPLPVPSGSSTEPLPESSQEVGFVKSIRSFLVYLDGLPTIRINDIVQNEHGIRGLVNAVLPDRVEVLLLDEGDVSPGQIFRRTGQKLTVQVGKFLLGRAVNPLGIPIDGKGPLASTPADLRLELDKQAPGIVKREFIKNQFTTGITLIDTLIPVGKGQRELVVGDARSGKTDFLIDVIVNQKQTNTICIYASIGKPVVEVRGLIDLLQANQALSYTIIVATSSTDSAPLIYLTPKTAMTMAEYFQSQGLDVLVILDDMGNHAKIHREISLLGDKAPGRESYPGDIFYQHSSLVERAGNFKKEIGGGSITLLPVIELNLNDFTTFIPTNLMSMTDGHLLFKAALYNQGQRPPIDMSLSVSRVGQQTQAQIQHELATHIKQILAQASQLETVSRFSFELPTETQLILKQKEAIEELIKQPSVTYIAKELQVVLLALPFTKFFLGKDKVFIKTYFKTILEAFSKDPELVEITRSALKFPNETGLLQALENASGKLAGWISQTQMQLQSKVQTEKGGAQ